MAFLKKNGKQPIQSSCIDNRTLWTEASPTHNLQMFIEMKSTREDDDLENGDLGTDRE